MVEKKKYRVYLWEWDSDNGEYIYRDYDGEVIYVETDEELWETISKWLQNIAKEAEAEGWECEVTADGTLYCTKCDEEGCYSREIGYDVEEED